MEKLLKILKGVRPDVDFAGATDLVDGGLLDSFDIVALVGELNDAYDVEITSEEIDPANFNSAQAMLDMIARLQA